MDSAKYRKKDTASLLLALLQPSLTSATLNLLYYRDAHDFGEENLLAQQNQHWQIRWNRFLSGKLRGKRPGLQVQVHSCSLLCLAAMLQGGSHMCPAPVLQQNLSQLLGLEGCRDLGIGSKHPHGDSMPVRGQSWPAVQEKIIVEK